MADTLTPAPVPPGAGGGRPVVYLQVLSDFAAWREASVPIDNRRKPDTVYNGLSAALSKHPEFKQVSSIASARLTPFQRPD